MQERKQILVTGDVVLDHFLYKGHRLMPDSREQGGYLLTRKGGSVLLYEILQRMIDAKEDDKQEDAPAERINVISELNPDYNDTCFPSKLTSYSVWAPHSDKKKGSEPVWALKEFFGYGLNAIPDSFNPIKLFQKSTITPDVLVLDDAGLIFRFDQDLWPEFLKGENEGEGKPWIVLKMSYPIIQGDLWYHLSKDFSKQLVTLVSIENIRSKEVRIGRGISWEQTAGDLIWELNNNPSVSGLLCSRHLIVWFQTEGALWVENNEGKISYRLIFDPAYMEGEFSENKAIGIGHGSVIAARLALSLTQQPGAENLDKAIKSALSTIRSINQKGHGPASGIPAVPFDAIVCRNNTDMDFGVVKLPNLAKTKPDAGWTIMGRHHFHSTAGPMYGPARNVLRFGTRALKSIPYARFEKLFTVDRNEIESYRIIRKLIIDYRSKNDPKPLSIAVFGPPGAGKSFGIKQLAKGILGGDCKFLEFNLSQCPAPPGGTQQLAGAFHQVRDEVLEGKMPIVFWDEFDSKKYTWLQYLLAPMQDGKFQEGQSTHPIGKCVFVFAGGTSRDFANFGPQDKHSKEYEDFKFLKGPDFMSRLNGYLNVLGPNRKQIFSKDENAWIEDEADVCFPIRRALMIRSNLDLKDQEELNMDSGLASALLEIGEYQHGARSLAGLISNFHRDERGIRRSDLPAREVMSMNVDVDEFMSIANRIFTFQANAEKLAPVIHGNFSNHLKESGTKLYYDEVYSKLPEDIKSDNRAAALRIPKILALVGLYVLPKESPFPEADLEYVRNALDENIELLAEAEHDGWVDWKFQNGWSYGKEKDPTRKRHNRLVPYDKLPDDEKEKDRKSIRDYPEMIRIAGHKIVSKINSGNLLESKSSEEF